MDAPLNARVSAALRRVPIWAVWAVGLLPAAWTVWDTLTGRMGVDPVRGIEHRLGDWALYLLVGGLALTPVSRITRVNLARFRRPLGLLAASYAALHLTAWAVIDMNLAWGQMGRDIVKRPWLTLGMAAALALVPLAATSSDLMIRRLGTPAWRRLHRLVYAAVPLAGLHALLVGKVVEAMPAICLALTAILLAWRAWQGRARRTQGRRAAA